MTTSKEGFPLKGGEDLLKGLKDLKVDGSRTVRKRLKIFEKSI